MPFDPWCQSAKFVYEVCCVNANADDLEPMVDNALEVTWATFRQHVGTEQVRALFPDYSYQGEHVNDEGQPTIGFHIKDDWAVSFWRSKYRGSRCYYLDHSRIEYIFLRG